MEKYSVITVIFLKVVSLKKKKDFIYLLESISRGNSRQRGEADSLLSREPNVGLDPGRWDPDLS